MRMLLQLYTHLVEVAGTPEGDGLGLINFPGIVLVKVSPTSTKTTDTQILISIVSIKTLTKTFPY